MARRRDQYLPPATPIFGGRSEHIGGPVLRPDGIGDHLLMYTFSGACRVGWAGGELVAEPEDMVLIAPWVAHDYGPPPERRPWGVIWAVFQARPDWIEWMDWPEAAPGIARLRLTDPAMRAQAVARLDEAQALS